VASAVGAAKQHISLTTSCSITVYVDGLLFQISHTNLMLSLPLLHSQQRNRSIDRLAQAACSCAAPNDTLTFSLETVEPVFSKTFGILVGLQSLGAGCDNNRWPLSLPSPSPPRSATHATPCLLTRSIKRSANLLCKHTTSVKDDTPLTQRSLKPALSLSMWPSMPHSHTSQCECGGPASEGAGQRFLQVHSVSL